MQCRHVVQTSESPQGRSGLEKKHQEGSDRAKSKKEGKHKGQGDGKDQRKGKGKGKANAQPAKTGKYKADNDVEMLREELMAMSKNYINLAKKYNNLDWRHRQLAKIVDQHDHKLGFKLGMNVES